MHDSGFFSSIVTAMALLSGFSFAAALQIMGSDQVNKRGALASAFTLYAATLLFLFAMWGFIRASAIPVDVRMADSKGLTAEFYQTYMAELGLALSAILAFLWGIVSSAWIRSPLMGKALLGLVAVSLVMYASWLVMTWGG